MLNVKQGIQQWDQRLFLALCRVYKAEIYDLYNLLFGCFHPLKVSRTLETKSELQTSLSDLQCAEQNKPITHNSMFKANKSYVSTQTASLVCDTPV